MVARASPAAPEQTPSDTHTHRVALIMVAILLASYAMNAMDRQIFPLLLPDVRKEFGYALSSSGLLSTIFTLGMAVAGLPTGYLLTRYSRKFVLQLGILIFSVSTAAMVISGNYAVMLFFRALTGVGEAMQVMVLIAILTNYFSSYRSAAVGSLSFTYGIGAIIGPLMAGMLLTFSNSWRLPLVAFGLMGIGVMVLIAIIVKPWFSETLGNAQRRNDIRGADTLWNHNTIVLAFVGMLWASASFAYFGLYPTYLRESLGYSATAAGSILSFYGAGALTAIGGGWLGDRFPPRIVLVGATFGAAIDSFLMFHGIAYYPVLAFLSFGWGVTQAIIFVNVAAYHVKAVRPRHANSVAAIFVSTYYASGSAAGFILGYLVSVYNWQVAANVQVVGAAIITGLVAMLLKPERMALRMSAKETTTDSEVLLSLNSTAAK